MTLSSAIDSAIANRDWQEVKKVLLSHHKKNRSEVGLTAISDLTPLQVAALYQPSVAHQMIDKGVRVDVHTKALLDLSLDGCTTDELGQYVEGYSPLGMAVYRGCTESIDSLIQQGDEVNRKQFRAGFYVWEDQAMDEWGATWYPIHIAAVHGYLASAVENIKVLVSHGADLSVTNLYGATAIHLAATHCWIETVKVLIEVGADIEAKTAPVSERVHQVTVTPPNVPRPSSGLTPLMVAVQEGFEDLVVFLLQHGADVNAKTDQGYMPLHLAAHPWWAENTSIIQTLLDHGADKSACTEAGAAPIEIARRAGFAESMALLRT